MDILLIGSGQVAEAMIDRLNKSGDRVYLLSGRRENGMPRKKVFERYDFSYEDDSMKDIFESVKPDVTVFLGALDANFDWQKARQESVRYTSSLINILSAYSMLGKGRFIYCSSQEVYGGSYPNNVPESRKASPRGFKAMAIAQGEDICANYRRNQGIEMVTLRFDNLYCVPRKGQPEDNLCFSMCLEALKSGRVFGSNREVFSMIFLKDAVELMYKAISAPTLRQPLYHISSMEEINGVQLAELVQKAVGGGIELVDDSVGDYHRLVLDGGVFQKELGQKILTSYQDGVAQVAQFMKRHSESFIYAEDAGGSRAGRFWHGAKVVFATLVPYIENIACFVLFFFLNSLAAGSGYVARLDFFLLYVLLFAVMHGQKQAVLSGLLAVGGYCLQQMYSRTGFEVLLDYNTYVWMAQLFIVGLVVGYIKDQLRTVKQEDRDEIAYLEGKLSDIMDINDSNVRMKENFETQLVNQRDSLGKIYEITSSLESQAPEEVLFSAARILSELMDCGDVAVYTVANRNYARLFSSTSREARSLGGSIEYTAMTEMYDELKEHRVYINRNMTDKLPLMASAVYNEGEMALIFMLWGIPWQRMTLSEANRLAIIGQLVQSAVLRANQYLETLHSQRFVGDTRLMAQDAFSQLAKAFFQARDQGLTECSLLEVPVSGGDCVSAAAALSGSIRQTDYMGASKGKKIYVLLPNTGDENAGFVMDRFRAAGYESHVVKGASL